MTPETRAVALRRLKGLLTPADIRKLLPEELEKMVAGTENRDRVMKTRLGDDELYQLLLDHHDIELLRAREVRKAILERLPESTLSELLQFKPEDRASSRRNAIDKILRRNWHSGKRWPRAFVRMVGLPDLLAGSSEDEGLPTTELLPPYVDLPKLHDFQHDLGDRLLALLKQRRSGPRGILSLPTGAGKTRTIMESLVRLLREDPFPPPVTLWIAQSEELCEQAIQSIREVWTSQTVRAAISHCPDRRDRVLHVHRLWGRHELEIPGEPCFLVAGIQKLSSLVDRSPETIQTMLAQVEVLVIDEAHHAIMPSYSQLFRALGLERKTGEIAVFGLTATPYRTNERETLRLRGRFHGQLITPLPADEWENPVKVLRERKILARSDVQQLATGTTIRLVSNKERLYFESFRDLPDSALRRVGADRNRNRKTLDRLLEIEHGKPVLFFACSVSQASAIAVLLRRAGRAASTITGETPPANRRRWIQDFKDGKIQFLCNYGVLTTGFDAPRVEVVVVARPTSSVLLYEQMVGRGMRGPLNGGTETCTVIDLVDNFQAHGELMSYGRYRQMWQDFSRQRSALEDLD